MIEVSGAVIKFDQRGIAGLHGIDLTVSRGEIFALLGPNGSGKTTLLNLLSGSLKPDSGKVKLQGQAQRFELRPLPPEENVQRYLISQVQADLGPEKKLQLARDFADVFEFTFQLRQMCKELSQGQRQKVMLAAELMNQPEVLLMDEPFAHLDPLGRAEILDSLFRYVRNKELTVLWVTHEREEALRYADRLGLLYHGKFAQLSSSADFVCPKNLFACQFFGYKNFLPIKKVEGQWQTPWGRLDLRFAGDEALLVIPSTAFSLSADGSEFKLQRVIPKPGCWEVLLKWEELEWSWETLTFPSEKILQLKPCLEDCFLIPL